MDICNFWKLLPTVKHLHLNTEEVLEAGKKDQYPNSFVRGAAWMFYRITNHPKGESLVVDKTPKYDLGQLTLPEAISHCLNVCDFIENAKARDEHLLLADWLTELQELRQNQKRILTWQEDYDRTYRHLLELIEQKELKSDYLLLSEENRKKRDRLKEK